MLESYIKRQVKKVKKKSDIEAEPATQKVEYSQLANHEKRKFVKAEEQGHTIRIAVRFYQIKKPVTEQHSYIVGVEMGGLSEEISTILEVSRAASFKELRTAIEVKKDRGMVRRTMTFQALRHFMELCTNHHKYSEKRRFVLLIRQTQIVVCVVSLFAIVAREHVSPHLTSTFCFCWLGSVVFAVGQSIE